MVANIKFPKSVKVLVCWTHKKLKSALNRPLRIHHSAAIIRKLHKIKKPT